MKIEVDKEELDKLTQGTVAMSMNCMALLAVTSCPLVEQYVHCEDYAALADKVRVSIGLEELAPDEMKEHLLSRVVAKRLAKRESQALASENKNKIGFQIPQVVEVENNPNKMN